MWRLAFQKQKTVMGITFQVRKRMTLRHIKSSLLVMVSSLLTQGRSASLWLRLSAVWTAAFDLVFLASGRQSILTGCHILYGISTYRVSLQVLHKCLFWSKMKEALFKWWSANPTVQIQSTCWVKRWIPLNPPATKVLLQNCHFYLCASLYIIAFDDLWIANTITWHLHDGY